MLLNQIIEALALGAAFGLIAVVYRCILAYEPVMNWWWRFGARFENRWFFRPVWECEKCIAGQMALWGFLILHVRFEKRAFLGLNMPGWVRVPEMAGYGLFGHVLCVCGAIFFAMLFSKLTKYLEQ